MPIVHVHVARGRSVAQRKAILDGVHAALVEAFRAPRAHAIDAFLERLPSAP